jgi:hypothetical protein
MTRHQPSVRQLARLICVAVVVVVTSPRAVVAISFQDTRPADAATAPGAGGVEQLEVTVTGVEGLVQVRPAEDQPWQRAAVGMVLSQDAEFRTGPKSAVRFVLPPDQTVTLDRLGTVKVLQAINDGGRIKTNLGMKYGRTRYDIEAAGREHESTISSPSSTLAVRGTRVSLTDQRPFPAEAVSLTGRAEFREGRRKGVFFGAPGAGKLEVAAGTNGPAETALSTSYIDPGAAAARTGNESRLIASLLYSGAVVTFDYDKGIRVVRGGTVPQDNELIPTLPGTLNFVLRWNSNADLNLGVSSPRPAGSNVEGTVYPVGGVNFIPSGGQTAFDHRGGPNGGIEIAFWPDAPPDGVYQTGVQHMSGAIVDATIDVFRNGQRVPITTSAGRVETSRLRVGPVAPGSDVVGQAGGSVRVFADSSSGQTAAAASVTQTAKAPPVVRAQPAAQGKNAAAKAKLPPRAKSSAAAARQPRAAPKTRR